MKNFFLKVIKKENWVYLGYALIILSLIFGITGFLFFLFSHLFPDLILGMIKNENYRHRDIFSFLSTAIRSPIVEEIIFRLILCGLLRKWFTVKNTILLSAVIFALAHPPHAYIVAFLIGALLGWLFFKTKTIFFPIVLHSLNNSVYMILYIKNMRPRHIEIYQNWQMAFWSMALISISSLILISACKKSEKIRLC